MKRWSSIMEIAFAMLMVLTACGSGEGSKTDTTESGKGTNKITIMSSYVQTEPPKADSKIITELEDLTNTDLDITWVPNSSYEDKFNVTLASGNLPNIMVVMGKTPGFIKSVKAGAFWDLTDYLKDYPNLSAADDQILDNASINGKTYGIYRRRDFMRTSVTIRKDWLDKLGLKEPETVTDLYEIAKAFTENDPDGNGKDDTFGMIIPKWDNLNNSSPYDIASVWFGAPNAYGVSSEGTVIPSFETDEYLQSLDWFKDMVSKGYVNPDFATLTTEDHLNYFLQGKGGIIIDTYSTRSNIVNKVGEEEAKNIVTFTGNLKSPDGKLYAYPTQGYSGMLAIPKSSVESEEDLKKVLQFINDCSSKEAQVLLNNGIEGTTFEVDDDDSRFAEVMNPEDSNVKLLMNDCGSMAQIGTSVQGNEYYIMSSKAGREEYLKRLDLMESDTKKAVNNAFAKYVSETYISQGATLDNIIIDARIKYIDGQLDKQGWLDAIELWKKSGGSDVLSELQELSEE